MKAKGRIPKRDVERASRLRRLEREGESLSGRDARWLAEYEARRPPRAARSVEERAEVPVEPPPVEPPPVEPPPVAEWATIAPLRDAAPAPGAPGVVASPGAVAPGAVAPGAVGAPLPTLHKPACAIKDCPGCAGLLDQGPQICATTGREVYPPLSDVAARGFAGLVFWVIGFGVRMYARIVLGRALEPINPTEPEREELAEALKAVFRLRPAVGWIGSAFGDVAAVAGALSAYGRRSLAAKTLPADAQPAAVG